MLLSEKFSTSRTLSCVCAFLFFWLSEVQARASSGSGEFGSAFGGGKGYGNFTDVEETWGCSGRTNCFLIILGASFAGSVFLFCFVICYLYCIKPYCVRKQKSKSEEITSEKTETEKESK